MRILLITTTLLCFFIATLLGITIFSKPGGLLKEQPCTDTERQTESQYDVYNNKLVLTINNQTHEYELWSEKPHKSSDAVWDIFYVKHADSCHYCDSIKARRPIRNQEIINK